MIGIVDMMGGFGNQLFQYGIGILLKKQGLDIYIYESDKESHNRKIVIPNSEFGLKKIGRKDLFLVNILKSTFFLKNYYEIVNDLMLSNLEQINDIKKSPKKIISFNGFWQKKEFVDEYFNDIKNVILENNIIKQSRTQNIKGSTLVHVRRTDYKDNNEVLSSKYYQHSLKYCKENVDNFNYSIFTDDYEWVKSQKIFKDAVSINIPKDQQSYKNNVLSTFGEMLNFENYIIANSTFSWWAAKISSKKNSKILYPDPFFKAEPFDAFYSNWKPINR